LDISRDPPQVDPVDYFVFERDEGFCEQIAATMALMLRAAGVPTRLVTGFGEGTRNLFTGYWEVNNNDAHAWVEVLYPGYGWVPYDPTFGVPDGGAASTTFMLGPLKKISEFLVRTSEPATSKTGA
jgi:transglutaminase-like putative cysteine protease